MKLKTDRGHHPLKQIRVRDVSNVTFSNGWILDDVGAVYIYYAGR